MGFVRFFKNRKDFFMTLKTMITLIVIMVIIVIIISTLGSIRRSEQKKRGQEKEKRRKKEEHDENQRLTDSINKRIRSVNTYIQSVYEKAMLYEDDVTQTKLGDVIDDLQDDIKNVHDFDEFTRRLDQMESDIKQIKHDMQAHEAELEEYRKEQRQKQKEKEEKLPYYNTKYYKTCKDFTDVKKTFRRLVKLYHPDNPGGDAGKYMEVHDEYKHIVSEQRWN